MGPYYAMFPSGFADNVVSEYSKVGDTVIDPFAGRGTTLFSAAITGRKAIGIEVNPVGWIYSKTKLNPAPKRDVLRRIADIKSQSRGYRSHGEGLPLFFHYCFAKNIRSFLTCARGVLDWRDSDLDRTVMAFLLTHLHGKSTDSLSNQMRQTKAMSPQYAVDWWRTHQLYPPDVDPVAFFEQKLKWRYAKGTPETSVSTVLLGDGTALLPRLRGNLRRNGLARPALMLTSPPYFGITNYHYDQWIRLWLLGGPPTDRRAHTEFTGKHQGKFENLHVYASLLTTVFQSCAKILRSDAVVYVRTDRREPTVSITRATLKHAFPFHQIRRRNQPLAGETQTRLFGHDVPRFGEVDFILTPGQSTWG